MSRLPTPGGDYEQWGIILNDYLSVSHNADGTLKTVTVDGANITDGTVTEAKLHGTLSQSKITNLTTDLAAKAPLSHTHAISDVTNLQSSLTQLAETQTYTVAAYGAVGDGSTDDTTAIQSAIDASATTGGVVWLQANKTYVVSASLQLPSNVSLRGYNYQHGRLSTIKPASGFAGTLVTSQGAGTTLIQQASIIGIHFDGSATALNGIVLNGQECTIADCTFTYFYTYGVHIAGISSAQLALNNTIRNCAFYPGNGARFWNPILEDYYSADTKITNNYIEGAQDASIRTRGNNTLIAQNHLYDTLLGIRSEDSGEKTIIGNYIENTTAQAILFANGSSTNASLDAIISSTIFRNINKNGTANGVIEFSGSNLSEVSIDQSIVRRDSSVTATVPYYLYSADGSGSVANLSYSNPLAKTGIIATAVSNT